MYRYILFDLDGTLTDSKEGIFNCLRYAFEKLGDPIPPEEDLRRFIGPPLLPSFQAFCGYGEEKAKQALKFYRERYQPIGKFENLPAPESTEVLERLKKQGYVLALASSKPEDLCISICDRFGFAPFLTTITGSQPDGDWSKTDVILETFRRLGITDAEKPQVLMVGDRKFDVLGAADCGIDCLGVEFFGYAEEGELKDAGAVAVVQSMEEVEQFILTH